MVETIAVYPVQTAPDGPLERIASALEAAGFRLQEASEMDLAARRGPDRLFLGLAAHPEGLAARWKAKSLVPTRTDEVHRVAERVLAEALGEPVRRHRPPFGEEEAPR